MRTLQLTGTQYQDNHSLSDLYLEGHWIASHCVVFYIHRLSPFIRFFLINTENNKRVQLQIPNNIIIWDPHCLFSKYNYRLNILKRLYHSKLRFYTYSVRCIQAYSWIQPTIRSEYISQTEILDALTDTLISLAFQVDIFHEIYLSKFC